jgi:2,3-bisphosphoglycerate-independent phosphoglycerate mutase
MAFVENECPGRDGERPDVLYAGLTRYYDEFPGAILESMDTGAAMRNLLGEVISDAGLKQLRIAETQKFRHVTSFFNGKRTAPYTLEDQVEIPSRYDASSFAEHPEMNAYDVRDEVIQRMQPEAYAFYAVNFANPDMVGHTGDFDAAKRAVEVTDECVGAVVERALELDAHVLLTADHGNAEQMIDLETGHVRTAHSDCLPVDLFYIARDSRGRKLIEHGKLGDIALTILYLLGLPAPPEMTADNLIIV